jgi:hypothetical protein
VPLPESFQTFSTPSSPLATSGKARGALFSRAPYFKGLPGDSLLIRCRQKTPGHLLDCEQGRSRAPRGSETGYSGGAPQAGGPTCPLPADRVWVFVPKGLRKSARGSRFSATPGLLQFQARSLKGNRKTVIPALRIPFGEDSWRRDDPGYPGKNAAVPRADLRSPVGTSPVGTGRSRSQTCVRFKRLVSSMSRRRAMVESTSEFFRFPGSARARLTTGALLRPRPHNRGS